MAIIRTKGKGRKRLLLAGVIGQIGKTFVVKQYKGKIVLANYPAKSKKKPSKAQEAQRRFFKDGVAYAKNINSDPVQKSAYARNLKGRQTVFQFVLSGYLKAEITLAPRPQDKLSEATYKILTRDGRSPETMLNRILIAFVTGTIVFALYCCSPKTSQYSSQQEVRKTFQPVLEFMDVKSGVVFADIGAASGSVAVAMSTLMEDVEIYIEDIDQTTLRQENLDRIIDGYSKRSNLDLRKKNKFHLVIGDASHTNLPDGAFDVIYTNATIHVFDSPDTMLIDIRKKLKSSGMLFVREGFKGDHGAGNYCSDRKCGKRLITIEEFLAMMKNNGYTLVKRTPDMGGYPMFGFALSKVF